MDHAIFLKMFFSIIGGLGIFLLGMKNMSEGVQIVAGKRMRNLINAVSNNRVIACGVGVLVTAIIQSSSITTVMVVGLVNAGIMSLIQALGIIMGAEIGTTVTGWILTLHIGRYGLPLLGFSVFFFLFSKSQRSRYMALSFMGLGMVFYGLELMKNGFSPLREMPEFIEWFSRFSPETYWGVIKCCLAGAVLTAVIQSSSATVGITMGLACTGIISFETSVALVLGQNIGTTITAYLASLGASTNAKRAAFGHIFFNTIGVLWITAVFPYYLRLIQFMLGVDASVVVMGADGLAVYPNIMRGIALAHTVFNVTNVVLFLPFLGIFSRFLISLFPASEEEEAPRFTYLDPRVLVTPAIAIQQSFSEILRMGRDIEKMVESLSLVIKSDERNDDIEKAIFGAENVMDILQKEITEFLGSLLVARVSYDIIDKAHRQIRMADEYESISDYVVRILKLNIKLRKNELKVSAEGRQEIADLHDHVSLYLRRINLAVSRRNEKILPEAKAQGDEISSLMKEYRSKHLARMSSRDISPLKSLVYTDMLNDYRRIKDHGLNIAEALAGEK